MPFGISFRKTEGVLLLKTTLQILSFAQNWRSFASQNNFANFIFCKKQKKNCCQITRIWTTQALQELRQPLLLRPCLGRCYRHREMYLQLSVSIMTTMKNDVYKLKGSFKIANVVSSQINDSPRKFDNQTIIARDIKYIKIVHFLFNQCLRIVSHL